MGARGPIPKRAGDRLGHNSKSDLDVDTVKMVGMVKPPACPKGLHVIASGWYRSLRRSGQSEYYEPSDWKMAQFVAIQMDVVLRMTPLTGWSPQALKAVMEASDRLLVTEAARRRARIEVERTLAMGDTGEKPEDLDDRRARLSAV